MTKEEADAKVTGLKEYAKATFDAAVEIGRASCRERVLFLV